MLDYPSPRTIFCRCKGCKNFRPWAAFGDKGLATKCVRCRERQREKYALQKEQKERGRGSRSRREAAARQQQLAEAAQRGIQQQQQVGPAGLPPMGRV